jgi:hypothetical protein
MVILAIFILIVSSFVLAWLYDNEDKLLRNIMLLWIYALCFIDIVYLIYVTIMLLE